MIFDSCILIDALNGVVAARRLIGTTEVRRLSVVTRIGMLTGQAGIDADRPRRLLEGFTEIDVNTAIADLATDLRSTWRLKTPDAIIAATARSIGSGLYTRDAALARLPGVIQAYSLA